MLPAPLRGAATLLAVLALAALLTTVRHNASAYLTGVWDTGSQTLVYGRIHQMEQGQHAPGGFLGVYTDDWSDDTNRALFRDDTPTDAAAFHPYTHQSGLQGWLFGRVNRLLRHRLPDGLARETALYWLNSTLFYAAELLVALAVWEEFGPLAAAFGFASVLLAPWLQRGMKDLYWCLWTWLLPLLAALWLCHCTRVRGKTPRGCWPLVAAACMVRCMCGFEFITTFLILCEIPLCYAAAKAYFVRRDLHGALVWLGRTVGAGVSALGGVAAALALWFAQEWLCFGSAADAWQNMTRAVTDRVSPKPASARARWRWGRTHPPRPTTLINERNFSMKYRCFAALALALLLPGCAAAPDLTPVWQRDLPASGVHIELANAALLSDADVYYAATREELYAHNVSVLPAVKADGQPVVTFYGASAQDIDLVYLEDIGDVYVDYDRVKPQIKLDYILTEGDGYVSYELDTAYNFEFTVTTQTGEDKILVVSERSDVK